MPENKTLMERWNAGERVGIRQTLGAFAVLGIVLALVGLFIWSLAETLIDNWLYVLIVLGVVLGSLAWQQVRSST